MTYRFRKLWLNVHLWLGLSAGLLFAFLGLTGSLLVFDHALDERMNASFMLTDRQGERRTLVEILAAAEAAEPVIGRASKVTYPRIANGVFEVQFQPQGATRETQATDVFVDPVSAQVLGRRTHGSGLMAFLYKLHAKLLLGDTGEIILGGAALLVLISMISGLLLWWPFLKAGLRPAFLIRRRKLNYDLHKSTGATFAPILLLIAFTGVYLTIPGIIKPVVKTFSPETKLPQKVKSTRPASHLPSITPDQAAAVATAEMPGCRLLLVDLPQAKGDAYRVFVRQEGEVGELRGVGRVWVDRYTGAVLATRDWRKFTFADTYFRVQLALHSGDAFGMIGRCLFCLAGLTPALLYVTGFLMWWRKRRSRRKQLATSRAVRELVAEAGTA